MISMYTVYYEGKKFEFSSGTEWDIFDRKRGWVKTWEKHLHRISGPAIVYYNGGVEYHLDGVRYSEEEYYKKTRTEKLNKMLK